MTQHPRSPVGRPRDSGKHKMEVTVAIIPRDQWAFGVSGPWGSRVCGLHVVLAGRGALPPGDAARTSLNCQL